MNKEQKTYCDVIRETVDFYGADPEGRRSINPKSGDDETPCLYIGPDGKRCAVARCLKPGQEEVLKDLEGNSATHVWHAVELSADYEHLHNSDFWEELQHLHDTNDFWRGDKGLTRAGELYVIQEMARWKGAESREHHKPDAKINWEMQPKRAKA